MILMAPSRASRLLLPLPYCFVFSFISKGHGFSAPSTRRAVMEQIKKISFTPFVAPAVLVPPLTHDAAVAAESTPMSASWNAVDGLNSLESEKTFVSFDKSAYQAMVNDPSRTPLFEKAIINRLKAAEPDTQVVLDLGTGPFALFAITAAKNGAGKVYAIEASKEAAVSARDTVKRMGFEEKITVLGGFSSDITLPDGIKADFAVAEIVGSVASEEGAYATILDAHNRLLKNPTDPQSWIPSRIQTYAAPASYSLHNLFRPPAFDWTKLNGDPVRFNCRDEGLQLLSDPVLVEDISFADIRKGVGKKQTTFTVDAGRVEDNIKKFNEEYKRGRVADFESLSVDAGNSVSGVALWPRLLLDNDVEVNSRHYPDGGHQRSHWQTVLPIMTPEPVTVKGGDQIKVTFDFDVPSVVTKPSSYKITADVVSV